ncbi:hypothetical protein [Methylobacterium sp. GC_Met_2]|uniref:hypothetical protein n=1 Tax=Methylobacterium sp. GC_Met_2 TaxID=2937376 RepID=UPI00226B73DD|nr:hypothetical protein [Methylobacterium sp. GC_Met_2]
MSIENSGFHASARATCLRLGIAGRATLLTLAIAFTAFLACSVYIHTSQSALLRTDINTSMSNLSGTAARSIGNWLRGKLDLIQLMAQEISGTGVGPEADRVLDAPIVRQGFYVSYLGRTDGFYTRMPKAPIPPGYDPRARP